MLFWTTSSLALIISIYFTPLIAAVNNYPQSKRKGLTFDSSCDAYRSSIEPAVAAVRAMAEVGSSAAKSYGPYFQMFFERDQSSKVVKVMTNIARTINGYGVKVIVKCNEDGTCLDDYESGAYLDRKLNPRDDYINICKHILDGGPRTKRPAHDFCSKGRRNETVASLLMHEFTHVYSIADNSRTVDYAYDQARCQQLAKGIVRDQNGRKLSATENANNYIWMAEQTLWWQTLSDPTKCQGVDRVELRKLLETSFDDDSLLPEPGTGNGSATTSDGNGNKYPVQSVVIFGTQSQDIIDESSGALNVSGTTGDDASEDDNTTGD